MIIIISITLMRMARRKINSSRIKEDTIIAAARNKLRVGPIRRRQQKPKKQGQHQGRERREKQDKNQPSRATTADEALKLIDHSFDGLGDAHAPDAHIHRYALLQLFGKPTNSESSYLGLEIVDGVTRIWGFPGEPSHMMELTPEARLDPIMGDASYHQDDGNKSQVCYGLEYPARTMHSFLLARPPLEGVELDGECNGSARENIIPYSPYYWGKGM
jgi:hypothetical protein